MMDALIDPWRYAFMERGLLAGVLVCVACAPLGVYVVLRRLGFLTEALSHGALPGVILAAAKGVSLMWGGFAAGLLIALGVARLSRGPLLKEDATTGILFSAMFALGLLLIRPLDAYRAFVHVIFGNLLGVSRVELWLLAAVAAAVIALFALLSKEIELTTVDPTYALSIGLSPERVRTVFLVVLSLAVIAGIVAVGIVLTTALLITPAATALLFRVTPGRAMVIATGLSLTALISGLYASYYLDLAPGGTIVLVLTAFFGVTWWRRRGTV